MSRNSSTGRPSRLSPDPDRPNSAPTKLQRLIVQIAVAIRLQVSIMRTPRFAAAHTRTQQVIVLTRHTKLGTAFVTDTANPGKHPRGAGLQGRDWRPRMASFPGLMHTDLRQGGRTPPIKQVSSTLLLQHRKNRALPPHQARSIRIRLSVITPLPITGRFFCARRNLLVDGAPLPLVRFIDW